MHISNKVIGKYLSEKAVKKSVNQAAHLSALKQLPSLVKTSILKESSPDIEHSRNIMEIQRLYGAVNYDGKTYPVKITVKVLQDKINNVYTYEVIDVETIGEITLTETSNSDSNTQGVPRTPLKVITTDGRKFGFNLLGPAGVPVQAHNSETDPKERVARYFRELYNVIIDRNDIITW
jgi:hypothetical protein